MLNSKPIDKVLFIDIETVPQQESFFDLSERRQKLFTEKFKKEFLELGLGNPSRVAQEVAGTRSLSPEEQQADDRARMETFYQNKAPLHPEFGKVACIVIGAIKKGIVPENPSELKPETELVLKLSSFANTDEKKLLQEFQAATGSVIGSIVNPKMSLCAHNGMNFDFPFLGKRMLLNHLPLPAMFDFAEKKPWDIHWFIDTKNIWKWGVFDSFANASQDLLCEMLDVPTSKDDMNGSQVRDVYYKDKDLPRIVKYCKKDVVALATIYMRLKSLPNPVFEG